SGAVLNIILFELALTHKSSSREKVFRAHVFREATFITVVLGPLANFAPKWICLIIIKITMVFVTMMWTLIPATSALQMMALSRRSHWGVTKRLLISFLFPSLCIAIVTTTVEELMPSPEFEEIMIRISQEVYDLNDRVITFGSTMRYCDINYGRSLTYFALFYAIAPYSLVYGVLGVLIFKIQSKLRVNGMALSSRTMQLQRQFFIMQLVQGILPLVILSSPFTVFLYAVFTQTDLGLSALWFTSFLWLCPIVQALVQIRYLRQASQSRANESTAKSSMARS
ncbi:hypothetical protein PFISCL1PPCAC_14571, partial [Pristionchus fissidentatus]